MSVEMLVETVFLSNALLAFKLESHDWLVSIESTVDRESFVVKKIRTLDDVRK